MTLLLSTHVEFITAAYAAVALTLAALVGWLVFDGRRQQAQLDRLEAEGVRRRSAQGGGPQSGRGGAEGGGT